MMGQGGARSFSLAEVRTDGWFDQLGGGSEAFSQLCEIVGARFVAFTAVAGVRITALEVDGRDPDRSMVEFSIGEDGAAQRLTLSDYRRRLAHALIVEQDGSSDPLELDEAPSPERLRLVIGARNLLLAPVLGIELLSLERDAAGALRLACRVDGAVALVEVAELRAIVSARIQLEVDQRKGSFAIDLSIVPEAERASREGDLERIVELLGRWPGPLSVFLRSAEGQAMSAEARSAIAHALGLLGTAHARLGQRELAEEIQRLGIQWASDGPRAPELFFRLGETLLDEGRGGEAIGFLRRALALARAILDDGDAERRALEVAARLALARAFEERERYAAALSSLERARSLGASSEALATVGARSRRALGASWEAVRAYLDAPAAPPKDAT